MIDFTKETVFPLSRGPSMAPARGDGRRIHTSTFHRWATTGCRGVKLETLQVGGTRCTSVEAMQRFFERLSATDDAAAAQSSARQSEEKARRLQDETTDRLLDALGL